MRSVQYQMTSARFPVHRDLAGFDFEASVVDKKLIHQLATLEFKAVYLAIGITMNGEKEVLGLWLAQTEGAKFWLQVVTELRNRGVQDIFIACVDGLKGLPDAIEAVFPKAVVQLCIVHMVRHSLNYVSWKRRPKVVADLRHIYQAATTRRRSVRSSTPPTPLSR